MRTAVRIVVAYLPMFAWPLTASAQERLARERPIVTRAELLATEASNLHLALRKVRPEFLRGISGGPGGRVWVRVGSRNTTPACRWTVWVGNKGFRRGLHTIRTAEVLEVRYIGPSARRPDGTACNMWTQALQVILVPQDTTSFETYRLASWGRPPDDETRPIASVWTATQSCAVHLILLQTLPTQLGG